MLFQQCQKLVTSEFSIAQDFTQQTAANVLPWVYWNRHHAAVGMSEPKVTPFLANAFKAGLFQCSD